MNSKQLLYFLTTAELQSISAASRKLDVAQPSITLQIDNLEHELGCVLFERDYKGMRLTDSGEEFKLHAQTIVRQIEQSKADIKSKGASLSGPLVIGMNQPTCNSLAVPLVTKFKERYPNVDLDLRTALSYNLKQALQKGEIDLAVLSYDGGDAGGLEFDFLFREQLYVVMGIEPKNEKLQPLLSVNEISCSELAGYELMVTSKQDSLGYIVSEYEKTSGVSLRKVRPFGQLMTSLRYIVDGFGLLLTPSTSFFHLLESKQVHALEVQEPTLWRDVYLVRKSDRPKTDLMRIACQLIEEVRDEEHAAGHWQGAKNRA